MLRGELYLAADPTDRRPSASKPSTLPPSSTADQRRRVTSQPERSPVRIGPPPEASRGVRQTASDLSNGSSRDSTSVRDGWAALLSRRQVGARTRCGHGRAYA